MKPQSIAGVSISVAVVAIVLVFVLWLLAVTRFSRNGNTKVVIKPLSAAQTIITRQSVMDACDFVVDLMLVPKFWSSWNSNKYNTLENVLRVIHDDPRSHVTLYYPMPILNVTHKTLLSTLRPEKQVTIVSNHGDEIMLPEVFDELIADERIRHMYLNNVPLDFRGHEKVRYIPIGYADANFLHVPLAHHVASINLKKLPFLKKFIKNHPGVCVLDCKPKQPLAFKQCKVMCAVSETGSKWTIPTLRKDCKRYLASQPFGVVLPVMEKKKYFDIHEEYAFEISPFGNGLECFRTWEALLLHTIPIIFSSPVNSMYDGLPVMIVEAVTDITPERLQKEFETHKDWFENNNVREALKVSRWFPADTF